VTEQERSIAIPMRPPLSHTMRKDKYKSVRTAALQARRY